MSDDETAFPGVRQAYDFVIPSYGWMLTRMEAANTKIQSFQTFAATITFAIPAAAKVLNPNLSFTAGRYLLAMLCFGILILIGVLVGSTSKIKLVHPNLLFDKWLEYSEWEFKKNAIAWAGDHFDFNAALLEQKAKAVLWMMVLFLLELMLLLAWIATSPTR